MRILHTSDWHLGQTLHQYERGFEHARFLDWLLDTLEAERVDALLIAGDIFDHTNPSAASQQQLYRFLRQARQRVPHLSIVMTAGNHDSPGRIEAPGPLLSLLDASAIGAVGSFGRSAEALDWEAQLDRLIVPLRDRAGQIAAWCIALPFLRPADLPRIEGGADTDPYLTGMAQLYRQAWERVQARRAPDQAVVAMGHCHMTGGQVSEESERRLVIGGAQALPAAMFDPGIAYVALGHLHLAQRVGGDETRRYCGSPLPLSFSEVDYPHQVLLVELAGEAVASVRELRIPRAVELLRVPKQPAPLEQVLAALEALDLPARPEAEQPYLQVRVRLSQPEPGLRASVEAALAGKPVRLVRIETSSVRTVATDATPTTSVEELAALEPADFFGRLYRHRFGNEPAPELARAFDELLVQAQEEVK
ncbi:exonuclease SbcCD subunit D C-terminal domain-containing protein [Malikia sp.]|uniref:exonuclease SbcCD subunit D n=1 Tax=Malikia sp. TaxID=2070706 RepID=UPI00262A3F30|nr:exonuclease SbcCD subunit D C-terminal domain-containing protein [Malikia sp.]MDD2728497.1 exonuclease SbcCD subunit D C-terminal domain-containing protein [Malikia sp.]